MNWLPLYLFPIAPAFKTPYWQRLAAAERRALAQRLYCFGARSAE